MKLVALAGSKDGEAKSPRDMEAPIRPGCGRAERIQ